MRRLAAIVCLIALWRAAPAAQAVPADRAARTTASLAIVGGRLIDGFGAQPLERSVVLVEGDHISAIGRVGQLAVPAGARIVDASGMTVMPGLWESHGHLMHVGEPDPNGYQDRFKPRFPEIMARVADISLLAGITSFRDTGGPLAEQQALRADIEAGRKRGPRLFLAGPILNQRSRGEPNTPGDYRIGSADEAAAIVAQLAAQRVDQIKVYGFWDLPVLEAVTTAAHRAGLGVDADVRHVEAYRTAIRAGVDRLHHVFTADSLSDYADEDLRLLIRGERPIAMGPSANILRGPWILPTIEMRQAYARALQFPGIVDHPRFEAEYAPDLYAYLRDAWRNPQAIPWGIGAIERVKIAKRKLRRFIEAGGREQIIAGCDAGSPLNFHSPLAREVANLVEAGLTPMEAIQAATLRPAQAQSVDARLGTVSAGKLADLIVVDGDPLQDITVLQHRIAHVVKNGVVYR